MSVKNKSGYLFLLDEDIKNREVGEYEINYKIHHFPDGEKQIELIGDFLKYSGSTVNVITRLSSVDDVFILSQACDIFHRYDIQVNLKITYLMSQRNDRIMKYGVARNQNIILGYIKPYIDNGTIVYVSIVEPHNPESIEKVIGEFRPILTSFSLYRLYSYNSIYDDIILFPDSGAFYRYKDVVMSFDKSLFHKVLTCEKVRDNETNTLNVNIIPNSETIFTNNSRFVIIDDLCDGGRTFIELANKLREDYGGEIKLQLIVTHAVNKEGLKRVSECYDEVITTDSFKDYHDDGEIENVKIYKSHVFG